MKEISDQLLRIVFDTAVTSMDFGSGFLDDEEVAALREVAGILGVDPDEATPRNFKCKYRGQHEVMEFQDIPIFIGADGVPRNTYRLVSEYPEEVRDKLHVPQGSILGILREPVPCWFCTYCGRRWDSPEEVSVPG